MNKILDPIFDKIRNHLDAAGDNKSKDENAISLKAEKQTQKSSSE